MLVGFLHFEKKRILLFIHLGIFFHQFAGVFIVFTSFTHIYWHDVLFLSLWHIILYIHLSSRSMSSPCLRFFLNYLFLYFLIDSLICVSIFLFISFLGKLKHPKPLPEFLHHNLVAYRMTTILVGPANSWCDFPLIRWAKGSKRDGLNWANAEGPVLHPVVGWIVEVSPRNVFEVMCWYIRYVYTHIYIYIYTPWLLRNPAANQLSLGINIFTVDHG